MLKKYTIILFLLLALTVSCAINPVTGKKELMLYSEAAEINLGIQTDQQVRAIYGVYDDPALNDYIRRVGMQLVPHTHRPHLNYHFAVLDIPVINAFAAPGGYIYVTRGILALFKNEAELATVLGHELGHVNHRHSVKKMSQLILIQVGMAVGSALSETFKDISGLAGIGIQLLFLKFSRSDEREADTAGVLYSRSGGYNPEHMISFFNALQKMGDLSGGGHSLPGFLSTHPLTTDRIRDTYGMLLETDRQLTVNKNNYLNRIKNVVYGEDPRQGFVEGNTFYHPNMRFSFAIPSGWKLQNQRTQVILVSKDENAAVILKVEESAEDLRDYAENQASKLQGALFLNDSSMRINGLRSYQRLYEIPQQDEASLKMRASYIRKQDHIYSFTSFSTIENYGNYDFQFGTVIGSFRNLTNPKYLNRKPFRVRLVKANGRSTLRSYFQQARIKKDIWPRFAIMNGMEPGDIPKRNQLIKVL
jgi:predicted Zn-dependent protease